MEKKKNEAKKLNVKERKHKIKQEQKEERHRYKEALKKERRYGTNARIGWEKLDNTAHVFPVIAGEDMTNVYRIFVILKEEVDKDILQCALNLVLPKFAGFNVRLRQGVFWYYFEENGKPAPKVREEGTYPCRYIVQNQNRSYLFRVSYFKCRI